MYQANPQQNSNDAVEKVELHVAGGSLTTTSDDKNATAVYSENKSDFITGGTFNTSVNSYVAESSKMETSSDASGDYTVTPLTADDEESVAKIGDTYYKSLQGAIDDAADGATIQLLKNITVSVPEGIQPNEGAITINKDITIDGSNPDGENFSISAANDESFYGSRIVGNDRYRPVSRHQYYRRYC